jgi:ATP-dependent exoDNAse (exonuclease V) alpha subunit
MFIQFDEDVLVFTKSDAQNLLLSMAINHFKIQGSQNKCIILLTLNQHKKLLNKQCLYTGLTRATEFIYEIADISAIQYSVDTDDSDKRDTFLEEMLKSS